MKKIQLQILFLVAFASALYADGRGIAIDTNYLRDSTKKVVYDTKSGLMWQDDEKVRVEDEDEDNIVYNMYNWDVAITYCEDLSLGGFSDWRMPNIYELGSLVDWSSNNPALPSAFENYALEKYWSSTSYPRDTSRASMVAFGDGSIVDQDKNADPQHIRCVRTTR